MFSFTKSLAKSVPAILGMGSIILIGIVLGALYFTEKASDESEAAVQASRFNARILRLLSSVQDAETGQRGYLLTGEEKYLQPFTRSLSAVSTEISAVRPQLVELGLSPGEIDELEQLLQKKLDEMSRTIELRRNGDTAGAIELVRSNVGLNYMDRIREIVDRIQKLGIDNSATHIAALRSSTTWLSTFVAISAALLVLLIGGAIRLIFSHMREVETARTTLANVNETLEETVLQRTHSLQRANDELQSYAYIVGHDLRAPLVNIMGFTEELDRASGIFRDYLQRTGANADDPQAKDAVDAVETDIPEALGFIRSSMRRMDNLINQILVIARAGNRVMQPEPIKLEELVRDTLATVQHRLDENDIAINVQAGLPQVVSDRLALQQIVGNLLDNAIKYMDPARKGKIDIVGLRKGHVVVLEIKDNGRGIADTDLERVFELFRRSGRQDKPGDGVGLAHVRTLTRRLGGDVTVRSKFGEGTTFGISMAADLSAMKKDRSA